MAVDPRRMSLKGTMLAGAPLLARVQGVIPSPGGVHELDVAWLQRGDDGTPVRRVARVHLTGVLPMPVHAGDLVFARGVPAVNPTGGLRFVLDPKGLVVEHAHSDLVDPVAVERLLERAGVRRSPGGVHARGRVA